MGAYFCKKKTQKFKNNPWNSLQFRIQIIPKNVPFTYLIIDKIQCFKTFGSIVQTNCALSLTKFEPIFILGQLTCKRSYLENL